jgi:exonuclease III
VRRITWIIIICLYFQLAGFAQTVSQNAPAEQKNQFAAGSAPVAHFTFNGNLESLTGSLEPGASSVDGSFTEGLDGQALRLMSDKPLGLLALDGKNLNFSKSSNFSVQCWIKTKMDSNKSAVILSQKVFPDKGLASQHNSGWVLYFSHGTWAWNMGSGDRRITYERENGINMPLNDGKWHQLTMTYDSGKSEVRLFYDGINKILYHVSDKDGFDFSSTSPLVIGGGRVNKTPPGEILPEIRMGAKKLQELVDEFNRLGLRPIESDQFESLIVDPEGLYDEKVGQDETNKDNPKFSEFHKKENLKIVEQIRADLKKNPYTIHQARSFMQVAPLLEIYSLVDGRIVIDRGEAGKYTDEVKLSRPDFDMDNLDVWNRVLSIEEVSDSYTRYIKADTPELPDQLETLTAAVWNIFHGGKHFTPEKDGWDSRVRIAEILKHENSDVIMMQETYSSGDFIAAELGYYFATTVDWDYLNQGANISVLSRYPIREFYVPAEAPFNNVGVKVAISKTQEIYVMSNWYGMNSFPAVYDFHKTRFDESDSIPTVFAGDFNAVPHTDGGKSPASLKMLETGFTDAFRGLYPDVRQYPGFSHRNGARIDQLYYKGSGLKNTSTKVISTWPGGFPSDHYLIISRFDLDY